MGLQLSGSVQLEGNLLVTGSTNSVFQNVLVSGRLTAQEIETQFVSASIIFSSGSNKFGDLVTNTQQFTGSLRVSGSSHHILGNLALGTTTADVFSRGDERNVGISVFGASENMALQLNAGGSAGRGAQIYMGQGGTRHFTLSSNVTETRVGTTTNTPLILTTNDTARLTISGSNVGVGITPEFTLDVNGDIALNRFNRLQFTGGVVGDRARSYLSGDGNNNIFVYGPSNNLITTFTHTTRVGIATDTPDARLHVAGTVEANGSLYRAVFGSAVQDADMTGLTGGNGSEVQIQSPSTTRGAFLTIGGGMAFGEALGGIAFYNSNNVDGKRNRAFIVGGQEGATAGEQGSYLSFGTVANTVSVPSERVRITSAGLVGIGTASPADKLEVQDGYINSYHAVNANSAGYGIQFLTNGGGSKNTLAGIFLFQNGTARSGDLLFHTSNAAAPAERMRITSAGLVGIGTATPGVALHISGVNEASAFDIQNTTASTGKRFRIASTAAGNMVFEDITSTTERMRITSDGSVLIQKLVQNNTDTGIAWNYNDYLGIAHNSSDSGDRVILINRNASDGSLIDFRQANVTEGTISVSGTTVSYNGGHLSRYSQTESNEIIEGLVKGTVMSNLDQMAVWINPESGEPYENEQLNCMKISDVEGDKNVAGVFVNWQYDTELLTNDMNIAMTGDMIIRIAEGVVVEKGDLLISAGDGTAKPQSDDLIRSSTIAKVISNHVTCVYEDGSYCVPCVLMAC